MSDDELIKRGDALKALDWHDIYGRNAQAAINAIPAVQPTVKPLRYIEPEGETLDQMRDHARQHPLAQSGDMRLVWINEGDLHMHTIFHAAQPTVSPDVAALVESVQALRDAMRDNIVVNDEPHTVVLPDGSRHSGPVVDFLHALLGAQISVLDAAIARVKGVM
jgi:hypothetical protein